jgi:TolB-like protein
MESDKKFSRAVADKLRSAGHRVLEARDQSDASRWITSNEPIDLLIADASLLAGRGGLAREFRCIRPALLLLFLTDLHVQHVMHTFGDHECCEVLSRHCEPGDVVTVAAALLRHGSFSREREELHSEVRTYSRTGPTGASIRVPPRPSLLRNARFLHPLPSAPRRAVRLGVLPFKAVDTLGQNKFSVGLAEELTTALGRFRWMSCVSPSSIAALVDDATVTSQQWEDLDLDYLLEGSFRQSGADIRITIRLINIRESSEVSWSKRFDSKLADVLSLQDKIAADTAAQVAPEVLIREGDRAASRPQVDPTSYGLMLQAIPGVYRLDQRGFRAAGPLLRQALELDPTNAAAHSWLAHWYLLLVGQGWAKNPNWATQRADELAQRAITLDPSDARGLTVAGHVKAFLHKEAELGLRLHAKALHLNPNLALAWCYCGLAHSYAGQHMEAIKCIQQAQRLSPHDPHGFFFDTSMVMPLLLTGDHALAAQFGRRAREANPGLSSAYKGLISALGFLGQVEEAQALLRELILLEPNFSIHDAIARSPLTRLEDLQHYAGGLRLAGCDEETHPRRRWGGWRLTLFPWRWARGLTTLEQTEE